MTPIIRAALPEDAAAIARVQVMTWRATYVGIVPQSHLDALSIERRTERWRSMVEGAETRREVVVVADAGGEVVGFASGGPERGGDPEYRGELYAIYVLPGYQRARLGSRLGASVARHLMGLGLPSVLVWVLADNPAARFYEGLGGVRVRSKSLDMDGVAVQEMAYGWRDVGELLRRAGGDGL